MNESTTATAALAGVCQKGVAELHGILVDWYLYPLTPLEKSMKVFRSLIALTLVGFVSVNALSQERGTKDEAKTMAEQAISDCTARVEMPVTP